MKSISIATLVCLFSSQNAFAGDIAKGKKAFKKCASCHSIGDGGKNKSGPNLYDILNRGIASNEKFKYVKSLFLLQMKIQSGQLN